MSIPKIPDIPDEERTPLVVVLLEIVRLQQEQIQAHRDEIAILKGEKPRPKIKPSKLEPGTGSPDKDKNSDKKVRAGSAKRSKLSELEIHETVVLKAEGVPPGSTFKGYEDYTVQGIVLKAHNILYRRERWQTPSGESLTAPLPQDVQTLKGGHFDHSLNAFALYQYHHSQVTQPLILEQLRELDPRRKAVWCSDRVGLSEVAEAHCGWISGDQTSRRALTVLRGRTSDKARPRSARPGLMLG